MIQHRILQLRQHMTDAEQRLRAHRLTGAKFRRQQPIGQYIVDFVCFQARLIIEADGGQHCNSISDPARDTWLASQGYRILRFWNNDILNNTEAVLESIAEALAPSPPAPLPQGERGDGRSQAHISLAEAQHAAPLSSTLGAPEPHRTAASPPLPPRGSGTTTTSHHHIPPLPPRGGGAGGEGVSLTMPRALPAIALLLLCASASAAQLTTLASVDSSGIQGNAASGNPALTPDGRCIAFDSRASNLVAGDSNGKSDVFVHDQSSGETTRASIHSNSTEANDDSYKPSLSADCRYVALSSYATNLVSPATAGVSHIYLHDRQSHQTRLISQSSAGEAGNGDSYIPTLSADGRLIAYYSYASNLVAGDNNAAADIFVFDLATATTTLVSRNAGGQAGNGDSYMPVISADGRSVAYESWADNLVADDRNGLLDIFLYDRLSGQTTLASRTAGGVPANGLSQLPALSADGRWLAYASEASDLVAGDSNSVSDIFLHDRNTATTLRISHSSGGQEGDGASFWPALSADGGVMAYQSFARNLVSADGNAQPDIFLHERASQHTLRVSVNASGNQGDGASEIPALSADGRLVAFSSLAANLAEQDSNGSSDVFLASTLGANWSPIPQTGWWWNPAAPGQGFFIETRGPNLYLATLLYAADGRATWYISGGAMTDDYHFSGEISAYSGGQTLSGPYQPPAPAHSPGTLALSFADESHALLNWPGGIIALQRFPIPAGNSAPPPPQPEAGWWWNPAEAGRGFTIEVQGDALYLAGLIYDASGAPLWIASTGPLSGNLYQGEWLQYAGGQTLDGPWTPPQPVSALPGSVTVQFFDARHAALALPDGRTIPLQRFAF